MRISRLVCTVAAPTLAVAGALAAATPAHAEGSNGTTLTAATTATAHYLKTYDWTLAKIASPAAWDLFVGDTATTTYAVTATKDAGTLSAYVDGQVCITNGGAVATDALSIADLVVVKGGKTTTYSGAGVVDVTKKPVLAAGESNCYDYTLPIPTADYQAGGAYKVTADVSILNHSGSLGVAKGPSPSADGVLPADATPVDDGITVTDTNGTSWTTDKTATWTYDTTFTATTAGTQTYPNTVTTTLTGGTSRSASADVTVRTYALGVAKTAATSYTRAWSWHITKSASESALNLLAGGTGTVNYKVDLSATSADSDLLTSGTITVSNPAPIAATLTGVTDAFAGTVAKIDCPALAVPAGGSLVCSYAIPMTAKTAGTNTATATQQNHAYAAGSPTATGTTAYTGSADVAWGAPAKEIAPTATVGETHTGANSPAGQVVTAQDLVGGVISWNYSRDVSFPAAGTYTVDNTASFTAGDQTGSATVSIPVTVTAPLPAGPSWSGRTPGYWKNHPTEWTSGYAPSQTVAGVFPSASKYVTAGDTLLKALDYSGGKGTVGAAQILLRAATAGVLNEAYYGDTYPGYATTAELIAAVDKALASGDRATMIALADAIDAVNNGNHAAL